MMVEVSVSGNGAVKIAEVMEVVAPDLEFQAVRIAMGRRLADGSILPTLALAELQAHRPLRGPGGEAASPEVAAEA